MLIDSHVHIGWFSDGYHPPQVVWKEMEQVGINKMVVSSTSSCADLYSLVRREMRTIVRIAPNSIAPVLWLTTHLLSFPKQLNRMINARGIEWAGIKIHPVSHPQILSDCQLLNRALDVAKSLSVPILIHTGEFPNCHASVFETLCKENPDIKFVLAHGRPVKETIEVMESCHNVFTDTAFMKIEDIKELIKSRMKDRVLFGSDIPINMVYYPQFSIQDYLKLRIKHIMKFAPSILSNNLYFK